MLWALILSLIAGVAYLGNYFPGVSVPAGSRLLADHGFGAAGTALTGIRWPLVLAVVLAGIEVNYRYAPAGGPRWRYVSPGALSVK